MRISYISFESPMTPSGVGKKMKEQTSHWIRQGHEVCHIVLGEQQPQGDVASQVRYPVRKLVASQFLSASVYQKSIRNELKSFDPDIVYIRPTIWWPGLYSAIKGFRIIEEVNTDLGPEIDASERYKVIKKTMYRIGLLFEPKHICGSVFTTYELQMRLSRGQPSCVIGNGIDFSVGSRDDRPRDASPNLIMVSSSAAQPWQGIDQLLRLATKFPDYRFHLVGPFSNLDVPPNVKLHGPKSHEQLHELYKRMDFGIGVLALHRQALSEACPLKVREYAVNGLPTIGGCLDTDLSGASYYLNVGDLRLDFDEKIENIRSFVNAWHGKPFPFEDARKRLSNELKEAARTAFFRKVAQA